MLALIKFRLNLWSEELDQMDDVEKSNHFKVDETQIALDKSEENIFRDSKTVHEGKKEQSYKARDNLNEQIASINSGTNSKEVFDNKEIPAEIKKEDNSADEVNETLIHQSIKNEFLTKLRASYDETIMKTNQKSVHEGEKLYQCGECNVYFVTKDHLEEHVAVHEQQELFKCINCDKTFAQKSNLEEHFENFHNIKVAIKCEFCPLKFSESKQMEDHIASIHDKNTLFQCIFCVKCFTEKLKLEDHVLSIHEEKKSTSKKVDEKIDQNKDSSKFCCRFCGCYFKDGASLSNHLENRSQCKTKVHLDFLKSQEILPSSFDIITNGLDNSLDVKPHSNSKILMDLPTEIINKSVTPENDNLESQEDVILGI